MRNFNRNMMACCICLVFLPSIAVAEKKGQDYPNEKCDRKETNGSITVGQCDSVCKDLPVSTTKDVDTGHRTCKAKARFGNWTLVPALGNSKVAFYRYEPGGEVQACSTTSKPEELECQKIIIRVSQDDETRQSSK